jgi:mRNA-degrading endonuclease RelE of RelBE toxin-antitoxin system
MPRYGAIWVEIAREQYAALPPEAREQVDARIQELLENPRQQPRSAYDSGAGQRTTIYGAGAGLIVYAVVHERHRLIVLRLV